MTGPTHLCLVSDQPLANVLPALDPAHRAARVVLAVSPEMRARAAAQERVLRRGAGGMVVELLDLPSAYDLEGIRDCIAAWLQTQSAREGGPTGPPIMLNATGGTKPMAMAAQEAFLRRNLPVFYLQADTGQVHFLSPPQPSFHVAAQLDLAQFVAAHGWSVIKRVDVAVDPYLRHHGGLITWMGEQAPRLAPAFGILRHSLLKQQPLPRHLKNALKQVLVELVDALKHARLLHLAGNVPVSADNTFLTGGWLERYVFTLLQGQGLHPTSNLGLSVKVAEGDHADAGTTGPATERNELDVALLAGNRLHALECKTVTKPDLYMDFLYKIAFQRRLGGLTTRLGLVALASLGDSVKERARNARIEVFDLDDWVNLPTRLAAWIGMTPAQPAPDADRAALALPDAVARIAERFVRRPPPKSPGSATYPQGSSQNTAGARANAGGKVGAAR